MVALLLPGPRRLRPQLDIVCLIGQLVPDGVVCTVCSPVSPPLAES